MSLLQKSATDLQINSCSTIFFENVPIFIQYFSPFFWIICKILHPTHNGIGFFSRKRLTLRSLASTAAISTKVFNSV